MSGIIQTNEMYGVGSRPRTVTSRTVKPTAMGGTAEKLEFGMTGVYSGCRPAPCTRFEDDEPENLNKTLGQSWNNMPPRAKHWRDPKTTLHHQNETPHRGGRQDPRRNLTKSRPYTPYTITPKGPLSLKTQNHTSSAYYGLIIAVKANDMPIRVTALHAAAGMQPRRELYRIYIKQGGYTDGPLDPIEWREVAAGEAELPCAQGIYGPTPFPSEGVKVQANSVVSIYVHCPYNRQGLAFRTFAKSWPGYPAANYATDKNKDLSILTARPTFSQTPFEYLAKTGAAFAGILEYEINLNDETMDPLGQTGASNIVSPVPENPALSATNNTTKK